MDGVVDLYSVALYRLAEQVGSFLRQIVYRIARRTLELPGYVQSPCLLWDSRRQAANAFRPGPVLFAGICAGSDLAQIYRKPKMGYGKFNNRKLKIKQKSSEIRNYGTVVKSIYVSVRQEYVYE